MLISDVIFLVDPDVKCQYFGLLRSSCSLLPSIKSAQDLTSHRDRKSKFSPPFPNYFLDHQGVIRSSEITPLIALVPFSVIFFFFYSVSYLFLIMSLLGPVEFKCSSLSIGLTDILVQQTQKQETSHSSPQQTTQAVSVSSLTQSCLTLRAHGLQHASLPCPSPTHKAYTNSCSSSCDAIQPSHPLSCPSPAFNLSQHRSLFQ